VRVPWNHAGDPGRHTHTTMATIGEGAADFIQGKA
jgi:hypothetical protein